MAMNASACDSGFLSYRSRVAAINALAPAEESALARDWRRGDQHAGTRLIASNLRWVIAIAQEYRRWGMPVDDLVQQGNIGLLKAAQHYDPSRETSLRGYAGYWIRAEIRDYVVRFYRIVRLGTKFEW